VSPATVKHSIPPWHKYLLGLQLTQAIVHDKMPSLKDAPWSRYS